MLDTTPPQSVSKNITCTSVRIRGAAIVSFEVSDLTFLAQNRHHGTRHFLRPDGLHAAEIDWAFAEETGAGFDMLSQDNVAISERTGQARLSRAKNSDHGHAEQGAKMHRAGIVGKH